MFSNGKLALWKLWQLFSCNASYVDGVTVGVRPLNGSATMWGRYDDPKFRGGESVAGGPCRLNGLIRLLKKRRCGKVAKRWDKGNF